jgi:hypothetical protein
MPGDQTLNEDATGGNSIMTDYTSKRRLLLTSTVLAGLFALAGALSPIPLRAADDTAVTQERLLNADKEPGNWLLHHKDFSAHRFSSLKEINRDTVKNLKVAWTMQLGGVEGGGIWTHGGLEGTPIVENGFMDRWSGKWIRRPITTGPAPSPAAASTTVAWRCRAIW